MQLICLLSTLFFCAAALFAQYPAWEGDITWDPQTQESDSSGTFTSSGDLSWEDVGDTATPAINLSSASGITAKFTGNILFDGNVGGGVYAYDSSFATSDINFSTGEYSDYSLFIFRDNSTNGGLKSISGSSSIKMTAAAEHAGIYFIGNKSNGSGGGIYSDNGISSSIDLSVSHGDISFIENTADYNGGGIFSYGTGFSSVGLSVVSGLISFTGNTTEQNGGGIYSQSFNDSSKVTLSVGSGSISFIENTADGHGGGIFSSGTSSSVVLSVFESYGDISFSENTADGHGGGIYSYGTDFSSVDLSVVNDLISFTGNTAEQDGGGIYSYGFNDYSKVTLSVDDTGSISFIKNTASSSDGGGGGIYSWSNSSSSAVALSVDTGSISFIKNTAGGHGGGGIYSHSDTASSAVTLSVDTGSISFIKNKAGGFGGGIYSYGLSDSSEINLSVGGTGSISFIKNKANGYDGGGIYSFGNNDSAVTLSVDTGSILFIKNTAVGYGGGIFSNGGSSSVVDLFTSHGDISIIKNTAGQRGGGIFSYGGSSSVDLFVGRGDISIIKNKVGEYGDGGGIYSSSTDSSVKLSAFSGDISIIKNKAVNSGGGIYSDSGSSSSVDLSALSGDISIIKNKAGQRGGGIYSWGEEDSSVDLFVDRGDISIIKNTAGNYGGGIYSYGRESSVDLFTLSGNISIIKNKASGNGGGIYSGSNTSSVVNLSAGDCGQILFKGNKHHDNIANAIYFGTSNENASFALNINIGFGGTAAFYDPITATAEYDNRVQVNLNENNQNIDDAVSNGLIIFDGRDYLNDDGVNRYYDMVNDTVLHNGVLAIANNVIYGRDGASISTMTINEDAALFSIQDFDLDRVNNIINADVTLNNSTLAFLNKLPDTYHTLNINSLAGNGDIYMSFDSYSGDNDILNIADTADGDYEVMISMTGNAVIERFDSFISSENSSSAVFNGEINYKSLYNYVVESANVNNTSWDLVRYESTLADVLFGSLNAVQLSWFGQLDNLNNRLRGINSNDFTTIGDAFWIRGFGNNIKADLETPNNVTFIENHYGTDIGIDLIAGSHVLAGLYGGYMRADRNFSHNTGTGNTLSPYGGFYGTFADNNGLYIDLTTKAQSFSSKFNGQYDSGDIRTIGFGGSLEIGKSFSMGNSFFVEPRLQAGYVYLTSDDFAFDDSGFALNIDDTAVYRLLGGFKIGQNIAVSNRAKPLTWYISADIESQTSSGGELTAENGMIYDFHTDGMRTSFGIGLSYNDSASSKAHIDIESSFGDKYKRILGISAGYMSRF